MSNVDENTKVRLGRVLMDQIGVNRSEFDESDLESLAACCRDQFVDITPTWRMRVDQVASVMLDEVYKPDAPTEALTDVIDVRIVFRGGGQGVARLSMDDGCKLFNYLTGREVSDEVRAEAQA